MDKFLSEKKEKLVDKLIQEKKEQLDSMLEEITPDWLKSVRRDPGEWNELESALESTRAIDQGVPKLGNDGVYQIVNEEQFQ